MTEAFREQMAAGHGFDGPRIHIGRAAVTALDARGVPTPVAATRLDPPASRMGPLTPEERAAAIAASPLRPRYTDRIDRESAAELLEARMAGDEARAEKIRERAKPAPRRRSRRRPRTRASPARLRTCSTRASAAPWCAR